MQISKYHILVVVAVLLASFAQLILKWSALDNHDKTWKDYLNLKVIVGYSLLSISLLVNIYAMSKGVLVKEVSTMETLSYFFVPFFSFMIFSEKLSKQKLVAIGMIMIGVVVFFQ